MARVNKLSKSGNKLIYYNCHRSRTGKQCIKNRKRQIKSQGHCKMVNICTSQIRLKIHGDELSVRLQERHYGHSLDLQHLRISKKDKSSIALKLVAGVTKNRIVDAVRDQIGVSLKRLDLLTSKDVDNIRTSFNIECKDGRRHKNDAVSVDLWVRECQVLYPEENPVIFYKRQGELSDVLDKNDFCLAVMNKFQRNMLSKFGSNIIAIDGTHGINSYEFQLTTLMVVDDFGQGYPAAFMFSNRKNTRIYEIFFESISKNIGSIKAKTFMSDITDTFYNAWQKIMGPVLYRLFCSWHIDRAWQVNLTKIRNKDKRSEVYKTLKVVQEELDEVEFKKKLSAAINHMREDRDTYSFMEYFCADYINNTKQWAYCYRKGTGINTNMYLESMHKILKYFYLNRKTVRRLDKGLHAVLKYVRNQNVERVIKLIKGKNTKRHTAIFKRHQSARVSDYFVQSFKF